MMTSIRFLGLLLYFMVTLQLPMHAQTPLSATKPNSWEQSASWQEFSHYDGRFSVVSPGPFTEKIDSVRTALGVLAYHSFFFQPSAENADNAVYMVSYCDYPEGSVHSDSIGLVQDFFDATQESAALSVRGDVRYSDSVALYNYPGRIWRIDYRDGRASIRTRAYVVANRYYAIQTVCKKELGLNPSSDRFLDSFRLTSTHTSSASQPGSKAKRRKRRRL